MVGEWRGNMYIKSRIVDFFVTQRGCLLSVVFFLSRSLSFCLFAAESYRVKTLAGPIIPVMNDDGTITVDMGEPILVASKVPTTLESNFEGDSVVEQTLKCNGKTWSVSAVSMGNPHAIIFLDDLETDIDFESDGPALESCPVFPARTNVEFVQVLSDTHLKMKVMENKERKTDGCP